VRSLPRKILQPATLPQDRSIDDFRHGAEGREFLMAIASHLGSQLGD